MKNIGVVEGFFGPAWPSAERLSYAKFLSQVGGSFYIYAPKQDPHLRKAWRQVWDENYLDELRDLRQHFQKYHIQFGVGFSPFGLGTELSEKDKKFLIEKISILNDLKIDILGLFFDDMPINENLAETQIETLVLIQKHFHQKIVFCPSFYTPDPILEKVFGKMPERYLDKIAEGVPTDVSIAWTGPKVISPEIPKEHLLEVGELLKRKPFIWENLFANDGPKNCKFLKIKPFAGRDPEAFLETEAFAFNMMNQPELSKIVFLSSKYVLSGEMNVEEAFDRSLEELSSPEFRAYMKNHRIDFLEKGLDGMDEETKKSHLKIFRQMSDPAAKEVADWLEGKYIVGTECLTD